MQREWRQLFHLRKETEDDDDYRETQISCPVSRSGFVHRQVLRLVVLWSMGSTYSKHISFKMGNWTAEIMGDMLDQICPWPFFFVFKTESHSLSVLGACRANTAQPPCSICWRLLGGLTKHFEELNVNEPGTHGFNFPGNSHVLGNEGGGSVWPNVLWFIWPQNIPLLSAFLPSKSFESLVNVKPWLSSRDPWNLERVEFFERACGESCPTSQPKALSHGFLLVNGLN